MNCFYYESKFRIKRKYFFFFFFSLDGEGGGTRVSELFLQRIQN